MQPTHAHGRKQPFAAKNVHPVVQCGDVCGYIPLGYWLTKHAPELRGAPRTLYQALGQFMNAGHSGPSKRELRLATGLSENTVDSAMQQLRTDGFLRATPEPGSRSTYTLLRGPWVKAVDNDPHVPALDGDNPAPASGPPPAVGGGTPPSHGGPIKEQNSEDLRAAEQPAAPAPVDLPIEGEEAELAQARAEMAALLAHAAPTPDNQQRLSVGLAEAAIGAAPQPPRPSSPRGISKPPAKAPAIARLTQATELALLVTFGNGQVQALHHRFVTAARWRAPGIAEAACRVLLRRKGVKWAASYVESLYADALAHAAQCALDLEDEHVIAHAGASP